jgi:oleandomycin transport system ATP-binding protein
MAQVTGAAPTRDGDAATVSVPVDRRLAGSQALTAVAHQLEQAGIAVTEVGLRLASLDEVVLALTGHRPQQLEQE